MRRAYLVKYGEIAIKGNNRYLFENALLDQIKGRLSKVGKFKVTKEQGRVFVEPQEEIDEEEVMQVLTKIFGLVGICPVLVLESSDFNHIKEQAVAFLQAEYPEENYTFKVEAKRAVKSYFMNSMEICKEVGAYVLDKMPELKVDVHKPQVRLWIEIRNNTYIYSRVVKGLGGMPVGTNGKAMLLLSGGIDSPVAGWMISKRGVRLDAVYFHSHPYTTDRAKEKVIELARLVSVYTGKIHLNIVPFTELQMYIYENTPHEQLTIIMRRIMMRIAEKIAIQSDAQALITGESIGQVASQTIQSLAATNAVCNIPVFRPLVGFDKQDIISISEQIGTFETSILPYEDCCTVFVAKHPVTKPNLESIEKSERKLPNIEEMMEKAINEREVMVIRA